MPPLDHPLSKRQQTLTALFPRPRAKPIKRAHQLGLGIDAGWRRVGRCPGCAAELEQPGQCTECAGFICARCDGWTSQNGGDGTCCARCA
jgi:hypothetical protein